MRYHIADSGGVIPFRSMLDFLRARGFDPPRDLGDRANVYPENVTVGLEQSPVDSWLTGKFVLQAREDDDRNAYLSIVVELGPGVTPDAEKTTAIGESILQHLVRLKSEFANYVPSDRQLPRIELVPRADPEYFPVGVKHRYTRR